MTIRFACECGRQLAVADEHAGKRVKCTACGTPVTVPRLAPVPAAAGSGQMIRFGCDCGQTCQARPEHAGKSTKCPKCGTVLTIPAPVREEVAERPASRRPAAVQSQKPLARAAQRKPSVDDDYEEDEDRPRSRKKKKGGALKWIAIAGAALLLIGGGLALFFMVGGSVSKDFDLVPRDAQGFVSIRVADLLETPVGKKLMDKAGKEKDQLKAIEDMVGLSLKDIERVTVVVTDFKKQEGWAIVQTAKAYDKDKLLKAAEKPPEKTHEGKKYYAKGDKAFAFIGERVAVFGSEAGIKKCLGMKKPGSGPLDDSLKLASKKKYQIVVGINFPADVMADARKQAGKGMGAMFADLLDVKSASVAVVVSDSVQIESTANFGDKAKAKSAADSIKAVMALAKGQRGAEMLKDVPEPKQSGKSVTMSWKVDKSSLDKLVDQAAQAALSQVRGAAGAAQASNNMRMITLGLISYADANGGKLPPAVIYSKNGQQLYSWRVAILPYIGEKALYDQFHLNEPWNSAHNRTLLPKMPKVFDFPGGGRSQPGRTYFQVFTGQGTPFAFASRQGFPYPSGFKDGLSNTVLVVEAIWPVEWTGPNNLHYVPQFFKPQFAVGNRSGKGALVGMADGTVRFAPPTVSVPTWKAVISPAGGEVIGADWPK